jgi:prevent-host-death family protein
MTTKTATEAKTHFLELIRAAEKCSGRFVITRSGRPAAVLMNADEYEGWLETLALVSDPSVRAQLRDAMEELRTGRGHSFEEVVGRPQRKSS